MKTAYAKAANVAHPVEPEETPEDIVSFLHVRKVVTDHVPLRRGKGATLGEMLDNYLRDCALEGQEVQDVTLEFAKDDWERMAESYRRS